MAEVPLVIVGLQRLVAPHYSLAQLLVVMEMQEELELEVAVQMNILEQQEEAERERLVEMDHQIGLQQLTQVRQLEE